MPGQSAAQHQLNLKQDASLPLTPQPSSHAVTDRSPTSPMVDGDPRRSGAGLWLAGTAAGLHRGSSQRR